MRLSRKNNVEEEPNMPSASHEFNFKKKKYDTPHQLSQAELINIIQELDLPKEIQEVSTCL